MVNPMGSDIEKPVDLTEATLRETAKALAPFSTDRAGMIWARSAKGGRTRIADIRGWGYLTGQGSGALGLSEADGAAEQARWAEMICAALNAFAISPSPTSIGET